MSSTYTPAAPTAAAHATHALCAGTTDQSISIGDTCRPHDDRNVASSYACITGSVVVRIVAGGNPARSAFDSTTRTRSAAARRAIAQASRAPSTPRADPHPETGGDTTNPHVDHSRVPTRGTVPLDRRGLAFEPGLRRVRTTT